MEARLAWGGGRWGEKFPISLQSMSNLWQRVAEVAVNPAQINYSADFIMGSENIKKYVAFRHQATKQHAIAL